MEHTVSIKFTSVLKGSQTGLSILKIAVNYGYSNDECQKSSLSSGCAHVELSCQFTSHLSDSHKACKFTLASDASSQHQTPLLEHSPQLMMFDYL